MRIAKQKACNTNLGFNVKAHANHVCLHRFAHGPMSMRLECGPLKGQGADDRAIARFDFTLEIRRQGSPRKRSRCVHGCDIRNDGLGGEVSSNRSRHRRR